MVLTIPPSEKEITIRVLREAGKGHNELTRFATFVKSQQLNGHVADIGNMIKGGPAMYNKKVIVKGELNVSRPHFDPKYFEDEDKTNSKKLVALPEDYPYTIDNITLPFNNAYNSWIRPTALRFLDDGTLILATYMGDIWRATGIDSTLKNITWQRIATGLFEPMGVKVVNDNIYVTTRNGITILREW
jgi:hypothetical protein